ncbi:hypothetical protein JCM10908_005890 [Rhodotorula pacifica]|uniref:uncharacterized protein n=1 Tax=Rhodotorula pacifica TaxID=1495444 RepID=UPI00316F6553
MAPGSTSPEPVAWIASLDSMPEEIKLHIAKTLSRRTKKPSVERYYADEVQNYESSELNHLGHVNRGWRKICKSLLSQHLALKYSSVDAIAAGCASDGVKTLSIELDAPPLEAVAAISHVLKACPNIDTLSLALHRKGPYTVPEQRIATTIGNWLDGRRRRLKYLRIFYSNDDLLTLILSGQVFVPTLALASQPNSYRVRSTYERQLFSQQACQALAHVHGVKIFTTDSGIPIEYLSWYKLTRDWPLETLVLSPADECVTRSEDLIPLIQLHANTLTSLRIEDEIDHGELRTKASTLKRSIELPHLTKLELVKSVPSKAFNPIWLPNNGPYTTFLDLLHPATPIELLRFHINVDSIASLCAFVKEQELERLRRIELCVRFKAKWYMGDPPEDEQWMALRSLCREKEIELADQECIEYTR